MSAVLEEPIQLVKYSVSDEAIAELREEYSGLSVATKEGYEAVRLGIGKLRTYRSEIEKRRVELKADALEWGRKVDSEAKRLTGLLLAIEEPLKAKKQIVDDEKDRIKREKELAEKRAIEEKIKAEREAEEARLKAIREAEEAKIREEQARLAEERAKLEAERKRIEEAQRIERERVEAEQRKIEEARRAEQEKIDARNREIAEQQRKEREAIEAERQKIAAENARIEREEFERQAKIKAEAEAAAKAERERVAAEEAKAKEAERQAAEKVRLEALKGDVEKVRDYGKAIRAIKSPPEVKSREAWKQVNDAFENLMEIADKLEAFEAN